MYFLKTQASDKVPAYVQVRNENYALIDYIKLSALEKKIIEYFPEKKAKFVAEKIKNSPFGKLIKID